ncbi:MAG TPA: hypothetical protein VE222_05385 [Nitrospiraceae bacterium]|jgi:hypothetical protein|nr:hypothetical protein [Nitrospiraceae bacterium]
MRKKAKFKTLMEVSSAKMLEPRECGSLISHIVMVEARGPREYTNYRTKTQELDKGAVKLTAEVTMTDCTRSIKWGFGDYASQEAIDKVTRAIDELILFRAHLKKAKAVLARERANLGLPEDDNDSLDI